VSIDLAALVHSHAEGALAQAVELVRALPELRPALREALEERADPYRPAAILGLVVDGDDLHRELARYALFCARQVEHLWRKEDREVLSACLAAVERWLVGEATQEEIEAAHAAAHAAAADAAHAAHAAARAAYVVADTSAAHAAAAAQRAYLADRLVWLLVGGEE